MISWISDSLMNNDDDEDLDIELLWKQLNAVQAFSFFKKDVDF